MTSQNYINHIVIVLDASDSMTHLRSDVVKVADNQIAYLAKRSQELDQETRITVYTFNSGWHEAKIECVFYDKDVLRLPSLGKHYETQGRTPLLDATMKSLEDLAQTPELYGDHAFLVYVLTDGQENASTRHNSVTLTNKLRSLPDNWTVAVMVPDQDGVWEAKKFGFPANNIAVWDSTSVKGLVEAGETIRRTTETFMQARTQGIRGSKNLFELDLSKLTTANIQSSLHKLDANRYQILDINKDGWQIRDYIETTTGKPYYTGMAYYQITKPEVVQPNKKVCVRDKTTGQVWTSASARSLLGLPDESIKVRPVDHPKYDIYIQSTSVNRKLVYGTKLLLIQ